MLNLRTKQIKALILDFRKELKLGTHSIITFVRILAHCVCIQVFENTKTLYYGIFNLITVYNLYLHQIVWNLKFQTLWFVRYRLLIAFDTFLPFVQTWLAVNLDIFQWKWLQITWPNYNARKYCYFDPKWWCAMW